jgi:hypothetical protein
MDDLETPVDGGVEGNVEKSKINAHVHRYKMHMHMRIIQYRQTTPLRSPFIFVWSLSLHIPFLNSPLTISHKHTHTAIKTHSFTKETSQAKIYR